MKTRECIEKLRTAKWIRIMALAIVAFIVFSYLHSRGISPVWAAVAIVCFKGFFRFYYKKGRFSTHIRRQKPTHTVALGNTYRAVGHRKRSLIGL